MSNSVADSKINLRQKVRTALEKISPTVRLAESLDLCARLEPQLQSAQAILFFAPLPDELDVWPLLEKSLRSKICALPAFDAATQNYSARVVKNLELDVAPGKFGVREPKPTCDVIPLGKFDLVLVPGIAFDLRGNRLGRGQGFYDRILSEASGVKCGVAYDIQMLEKIPTEAHDVKVNFVVTPNRCLKCDK
jgi:5-formyltetrahydrofolate cyclo-ligase